MMSQPDRAAPSGRWTSRGLLSTAFVAIGLLFALTTLPVMLRAREFQDRARAVASNMMASISLVSRMASDIQRKRLLIDAHIFETESVAMEAVERQIAALDADFEEKGREYAPLATLPGEREAYERLRAGVEATKAPIAAVLALSRENREAEAQRAIAPLGDQFAAIDGDLALLVRLNREGAEMAAERLVELQRRVLIMLAGLALAGIALTAAVGVLTMRVAARRDEMLRRYHQALETQNLELDAFAGRVAHDLRGPLASAALAVARLERASSDAQRAGALQTIGRSMKQMAAMIDDLLALSGIGADAQLSACDLRSVVTAALESLTPPLEVDAAVLEVDVEPARVRCKGEQLLRQALWNLIDNARKYRRAEEPLRIAIRGRAAGGRYLLKVSDNGRGMSRDDARRAFNPLYRAERARDVPGTGLGLSIVKRVIEASEGTVFIQSRLDVGTTFLIELQLET